MKGTWLRPFTSNSLKISIVIDLDAPTRFD